MNKFCFSKSVSRIGNLVSAAYLVSFESFFLSSIQLIFHMPTSFCSLSFTFVCFDQNPFIIIFAAERFTRRLTSYVNIERVN